jgi:hypothetical protein
MRLIAHLTSAVALLIFAALAAPANAATLVELAATVPYKRLDTSEEISVDGGMAIDAKYMYFAQRGALQKYEKDTMSFVRKINTYSTKDETDIAFVKTTPLTLFSNTVKDKFYFCATETPAIYRYNVLTETVDRMAGDGKAGVPLNKAVGTNARVACDAKARQAATINYEGTDLYYFNHQADSYVNNCLMKMTIEEDASPDSGEVSKLAGDGTNAHADGIDIGARIKNPRSAFFYRSKKPLNYVIFSSDDASGAIRYCELVSHQVSTAKIAFSPNSVASGVNAEGRMPAAGAMSLLRRSKIAAGHTLSTSTDASRFFFLTFDDALDDFRLDFSEEDGGVMPITSGNVDLDYLYTGSTNGGVLRHDITVGFASNKPKVTRAVISRNTTSIGDAYGASVAVVVSTAVVAAALSGV